MEIDLSVCEWNETRIRNSKGILSCVFVEGEEGDEMVLPGRLKRIKVGVHTGQTDPSQDRQPMNIHVH